MNWHVQFVREINSLLVWGLVPFIGLISSLKVVWDWYLSGIFTAGNALQLVVSVAVVVACGYFARKDYQRWQANALAGTTDIGPVVRVLSSSSSDKNVLRLIIAVVLLVALAAFRSNAIAPILILWWVAAVWLSVLATFMADQQCIIGTQGLWTVFMGWKVSVPYSSIDGVNRRTAVDNTRVWITLLVKEALAGRVFLTMPLKQEVADILEGHIRVESSASIKA
jgi:hypothetical protein